jgi:hypothetical protein
MRTFKSVVSAILFLSLIGATSAPEVPGKFNEPMTFVAVGNGGNCGECEWISATGVIGQETPQRFRDFMAKRPGGAIFFNSPGGDLWAGFELGRIIREMKWITNVGETFRYDPKDPRDFYSTRPRDLCQCVCICVSWRSYPGPSRWQQTRISPVLSGCEAWKSE